MARRRPWRAAIVGAGQVVLDQHVPAFASLGRRVELVAAVDPDPARRARFARATAVECFSSLEELLATASPDLVVLSGPPGGRAEQAVACLSAGAWVLAEKPPATSLAGLDRIAGAERSGGARFGVVYQWRAGAAARAFASDLGRGSLGPVLTATCATQWYRDGAYFEAPWRGRFSTEAGGPTVGIGIHALDLACFLLGDFAEVTAMAGRLARPVETEDVSMAVCRFGSGTLATFVSSVLAPRESSELRFDMPQGTLELRHDWGDQADWVAGYRSADWRFTPLREGAAGTAPSRSRAVGGRGRAWRPPADRRSHHAELLSGFLDSMGNGAEPPTGGREARRAFELATAIYQSALTGRLVRPEDLAPGSPFYDGLDGGRVDPFGSGAAWGGRG